MRTTKTQPESLQEGQTRTVSRFLWWPLTIGGEKQWLERAVWVEVWTRMIVGPPWTPRWVPAKWALTPQEQKQADFEANHARVKDAIEKGRQSMSP